MASENEIDMSKKYPHAIACLNVSVPNKSVQRIDDGKMQKEDDEMAKKSKKNDDVDSNKSSGDASRSSSKAVEKIWKMMATGEIDISYACIGYALDGRPVLNHNNFLDMLVSLGFTIDDALSFTYDFAEATKSNDSAPILMTDINSARIATELNPDD